ncbi:DUF1735 domain-containing protein [Dyadobacter chenwenxiniae]|uniref:DUF1735 domain-containing protein n=1 Tax=Dyadobacter chenwenxiniae TaxID=2906456 RepID=A0A9X1PPH0_9BACT|nr:DUF1735 domain-containing protein [Dyadobacter chenwenxiniae]MCF0064995.1 DUF1735 domain-containing protein [Dyadobacter chenwenxiniae]UON83114.1 DUF1735 domain-containing protein [Dyadobacter chenwenxiniae]
MKYSIKIAGLFLFGVAITSCLKDDMNLDPDTSTNVVEFKNPSSFVSPSGSTYSLYTQAFDLAEENDYAVTVSYSGASVAPEDIRVTLGLDTAAITQYNTEQETHFDLITPDLYTMPTEVTIPKGQRTATVNIKVRSSKFDFSKAYVLPISIVSASTGTVSGNFGTILLSLNAKNKYDGNYTVTATDPMVDKVNPLITGYYPINSDLHTTGANSVVMYSISYLDGLEGHPIKSKNAETGAISDSYYGSFAPVFTMDATGKVISVTNFYGQPAGNGRSARLDPTGVNKFTINADGSKVLEVKYVMQQAGPTDRTFFSEKWTFKAPR